MTQRFLNWFFLTSILQLSPVVCASRRRKERFKMTTRQRTTQLVKREDRVNTLAVFLWAGVPVCLKGHPGTTKSATCRAIFDAFGWQYSRIGMPGITDPVLITGLPNQDDEMTRTKPYPWLHRAIEYNKQCQRNGLIFDDVGECPRSVQSAMLDLLGEKAIEDCELPFTSMVLTANPIAGDLQVTPAMANRIGHYEWSNSPQEQAALMLGNYPLPEIPQFEEDWEDQLPGARAKIASFLNTLHDFDAPDLDSPTVSISVGAYPTGRTWELSARVLAAIEASSLDEERARVASILAVKSLVGEVAASAFFTFLAYPDMLRPSDVVLNPRLVLERKELFQVDRPDRAFVFLSALTKYVIKSHDLKSWKAAWEVLGHFAEKDCAPLCGMFAVLLNRRRPANAGDVSQMRHFQEILSP